MLIVDADPFLRPSFARHSCMSYIGYVLVISSYSEQRHVITNLSVPLQRRQKLPSDDVLDALLKNFCCV